MNRIKELRAKKGIRQIDLAKYLNIAQNTLSYWEKGKYDINNSSLQKLAIYFEATTDYILGLTSNSSLPDSQKNITGLDEEALQILAKNNDFSQKDVEYLRETIKLLEMKNKTKTLNDEFGKKSLQKQQKNEV